jgi:mono/diheme cytochrome c family protein
LAPIKIPFVLDSRTVRAALVAAVAWLAVAHARAEAPVVSYAAQGWSDADRTIFYTTGQGSQIMPAAWFKALRRLDADAPFDDDQLARYGYLPWADPANPLNLPIGFVVDGDGRTGQLGMTCAACHTGQIEYQKDGVAHALRIDGAPANADFQRFLTDLTAAARATLLDPTRFSAFAESVLGSDATADATATLKTDFGSWVAQFGQFMDASLPSPPWGPRRLDAFGMIFNRVAGLDLGMMANLQKADAPVRYPFLWNASRQDHTQWTGMAPNGLFLQALARNTGEVFGVFAKFAPWRVTPKIGPFPAIIDFHDNTADFEGLQTLEEKIAALQPPPWPRDVFPIDDDLFQKGGVLYKARCESCHAEPAQASPSNPWVTPILPVGTDAKTATNADRSSDPGPYTGALLPPPAILKTFTNPEPTVEILAASVVGSILDEVFNPPIVTPYRLEHSGVWRAIAKDFRDILPQDGLAQISSSPEYKVAITSVIKDKLANLYLKPAQATPGAAYEARVLRGVWAAAPYLHNGSVASLWELLTPAAQRKAGFIAGSRQFDPKNVGFAIDQSSATTAAFTVDATTGNGNGGHDGHAFGTDLTDDERWQLIEYMKGL